MKEEEEMFATAPLGARPLTPPPPARDDAPDRFIWMRDEDTMRWVLVGLYADGEEQVQDPRDYEDVSFF